MSLLIYYGDRMDLCYEKLLMTYLHQVAYNVVCHVRERPRL